MRAFFLVWVSTTVACSTADDPVAATNDSGRSDTAVVVDARSDGPPSDAAASDTAAADSTADAVVEASSDTADASIDTPADATPPTDATPLGPIDCLKDDVGPSSTTLVDFLYERQVDACTSSACSDFVKFDPSCKFTVQVKDVEHTATLSADHCAKLTKWLTSDLLVTKIEDKVTCYGVEIDGKFESSQLSLGKGRIAKKTFMCADEPFASHRACLDGLRTIYFPGL